MFACCYLRDEKESSISRVPSYENGSAVSAPSSPIRVKTSSREDFRTVRQSLKYRCRCRKRQLPRATADAYAQEGDEFLDGYGQFKYCGLRSDPFRDPPPQIRNWTSQDIPLPSLDPKESSAVSELTSRLADLVAEGHKTDGCTILRFLRERDLDVDAAEEFFRTAIKWKQDNDTERALTHWNLDLYERCLAPWWPSGGFLGHGFEGEPVVLERLGKCHWSSLYDNVPLHVLQKMDIVHTLRTLAGCEEDAARRRVPFVGATLIEDLSDISWRKFKPRSLKALGEVFYGRLFLAPRTGKRIIIINAPAGFAMTWNAAKNLVVKPHTASLVQFVPKRQTLAVLRKYMDDSVIPAYLGGSKCVHGDNECRTLLAPGGQPPPAVFKKLNRLIRAAA